MTGDRVTREEAQYQLIGWDWRDGLNVKQALSTIVALYDENERLRAEVEQLAQPWQHCVCSSCRRREVEQGG